MGHVLVVKALPPDDDFDVDLECDGNCDCYTECTGEHLIDHEVEEHDPNDTEDCPCDPYDGLEWMFHGVWHTWHWGLSWTVPFEGCGVRESLSYCDSPWEIAREHGPGRWQVDSDWTDYDHACLFYIGPEEEL